VVTLMIAVAVATAVGVLVFVKPRGGRSSESGPAAYCVSYKYIENDNFRSVTLFGVRERQSSEHRFAVRVDNESFAQEVKYFEKDLSHKNEEGEVISTYVSSRLSGEDKLTLTGCGNGEVPNQASFIVTIISLYEATK
jgi:hypothetical protein